MALQYDEIGDLLKIIDSSSCEEFVLETEDIKLVVRRHGGNGAAPALSSSSATQPAAAAASAAPASVPSPPAASEPSTAQASGHVMKAPMVGTFYRAPSPDAPPFVEVGAQVKKGDPLCIIEVMKLFTTLYSEWDGSVVEVGPQDAELVEYGQMLFVIAPD